MLDGVLAELEERRAEQALQFGIALAMELFPDCLHGLAEHFSAGVDVEFDKLAEAGRHSFSSRGVRGGGAARILPQDLPRSLFVACLLKFFCALMNVSRRDIPDVLGKQHAIPRARRKRRPELALRRIGLRISRNF